MAESSFPARRTITLLLFVGALPAGCATPAPDGGKRIGPAVPATAAEQEPGKGPDPEPGTVAASGAASGAPSLAAADTLPDPRGTASLPKASPPPPLPEGPLKELIAAMSLRDKVAQLFITWIPRDADGAELDALRDYRPGGYILYPWNYTDAAGVRALTARLSAVVGTGRAGAIRPFICADQEGGRVTAFRFDGFPVQPSAFRVGSLGDPGAAEDYAYATALALADLGVNMNLAPVADLYPREDATIIGDRSFGPDPAITARAVSAYLGGLARGGIIGTLKHFPGHGITTVDSHGELPVVASTAADLRRTELVPFAAGIRAGAPVVMTAHILYPAIDAVNPATLSAPILRGLLRDELGFEGLILTDGFEMGALSRRFDKGESLSRALDAGVNAILLYSRYRLAEMIYLTEHLVFTGRISEATIDHSVFRILAVKQAYGLLKAN